MVDIAANHGKNDDSEVTVSIVTVMATTPQHHNTPSTNYQSGAPNVCGCQWFPTDTIAKSPAKIWEQSCCCYGTDESITVTIISPTFHFTLRHHPRLLHRTSLVVVVVVVAAAVGDHNIPAGVWQCRLSLVAGVNRVMELAGSVRCR